MIGVYRAGDSLLHRSPAGAKLLALLVFTTLLLIFRAPVTMGVGLIVVVLAYALAAYTPVVMLQQIWPMKWIVVLLFPFQWWIAGWQAAVIVVGTLVLAVAAAGLVSLTTRTTDLLAVIERAIQPLRYVRVDPERVALLLTLTIRVVPVINGLVHDVRDARRARGMERSVRAYVTPVVIRTVGYAERLGDALVARGVDD
jgi:biotin transport system permease protein